MKFRFAKRTQRARKQTAHGRPDDVIRAFLRTLAHLAPRASAGAAPAVNVAREKP